jgi:hypothetical protein
MKQKKLRTIVEEEIYAPYINSMSSKSGSAARFGVR